MSPLSLAAFADRMRVEGHDQRQARADSSFFAVRSEWQNPTDILTILMIIGGDVVQCALAQLVGSSLYFTPIAFSFGWVSYSFSTIFSVIGTGGISPKPDTDITCINIKTGYDRDVNSWVLSRLYRDLIPRPTKVPPPGLTFLFYQTLPLDTGTRSPDWVYYLSVFVIALQLVIACIPGALQGDWVILIITVGGTLLAQLSAALPQWQTELWCARQVAKQKDPCEVVCLTAGNGSSHVVVIKSVKCGLKLEDLAAGRIVPSRLTSVAAFVMAMMWIVHLMTVQSVNNDGWYLLAIGGVGMLQNVISAGARRTPSALGFHLEDWKIDPKTGNKLTSPKVVLALRAAEEVERRLGLVLVDVFFPGGLREEDEKWRQDKLTRYKLEKEAEKRQKPPTT